MFEKPKICYIFIFITSSVTSDSTTQPTVNIRQMLIEEMVIPHVLPDCPSKLCTVKYNNRSIITGQHMRSIESVFPPNVTWEGVDYNAYHTLYVLGANRWMKELYPTMDPLREGLDFPRAMQWENWVVMNIPGDNVSAGFELSKYMSPGYPLFHQVKECYVILIYKQPYKFDIASLQVKPGYPFPDTLKIVDFVKMYNLTGPLAINYFTTQWDNAFKSTMSSLRWAHASSINASGTRTRHIPYYPTHLIRTLRPEVLAKLRNFSYGYVHP